MAEGFTLGKAEGYIDFDISGASRSLTRIGQQYNNFINRTATQMQNLGNRMASAGSGMTMGLTAPILALGGVGVNAAADFDDAMTEIAARTGLAGSALEEVRAKALELGRDTQFSATQSASAFLQLTTAGLTTEQAMQAIDASLNGAAAGGVEIATAADLATNVMSAFQLEATDVEGVIDTIIQAAASSPASFSEMGEALQSVGGMAAQFGMDYEQTSAVMAIFAQNGIRGAEAGTQLRSMLRMMSNDTPAVQAAWEELGISMYDVNGNVRNMDTVFAELGDAMEGLSEADRIRLTQTLAGSYGLVGFNAILASDGISEMEENMSGQADAVTVAEQRMASFNGRLTSLKGSMETLLIQVFTPFMNNALLPLIDHGITFVNMLTAWIVNNESLVQKIISFAAVLAGIGPVLFIVGKAIAFLGFLFGVIFNPITWIVGLISLLAYHFRDDLIPVVNQFRSFFHALINSFSLGMGPLAAIQRALNIAFGPQAGTMFMTFVTQFQTVITNIWTWLNTVAIPAIIVFITWLRNIWLQVSPYFTMLFNWFTTSALPMITGFIMNTVVPIIRNFIHTLMQIWTFVSPYLQQLFNWFAVTGLPWIWLRLQWFINLLSGIWALVSAGVTALRDNLDEIFTWINDNVIQPVIDKVQDLIDFFSTAQDAASNLAEATGLDGVGNSLNQLSQIGGFINSGQVSFSDVGNAFSNALFGGSRDSGGPGRPGTAYAIGTGAQPEYFIPDEPGQFYPNGQGLGTSYQLNNVTIVANNPQEFERQLGDLATADGDF